MHLQRPSLCAMFALLVAAALAVLHTSTADAFLIRQYPPNVYVDPTTTDPLTGKPPVKTQAFVDVTCTSSDWGSSGAIHQFDVASAEETGVTYKIHVKCGVPTYVYDLTTYGYSPQDAQLFISSMCRTTDNSPLNESYAEITARAALPPQAKRVYRNAHGTVKYAEFTETETHATRVPLSRPRRRKERAPLHPQPGSSPAYTGDTDPWAGARGQRGDKGKEPQITGDASHGRFQLQGKGKGPKSGGVFRTMLISAATTTAMGLIPNIWGCEIEKGIKKAGQYGAILYGLSGIQRDSCNDGVDPETAKKLDELQSRIDQADRNLVGNSTLLWSQVDLLYGNQSKYMQTNNDQWLTQNDLNNATRAQLDSLKETQTTFKADLAGVTAQLAAQQGELQKFVLETNGDVERVNWAVANLSQSTSNSIMWAFANISALANSSSVATQSLYDQLTNLQEMHQKQVFFVNTMISTVTGNIMRGLLRVQDRRGHTKRIRSYIDAVEGAPCGNSPSVPWCNYSSYVSELGYPSQINNGDAFYLEVENVFVRYIVPQGSGVNLAWEDSFQFVCGANVMIDGLMTWQSPNDVLNGIGPSGCDPSAIVSGYCNCYVLLVTQFCVADGRITHASGPYSFANASSPWNTNAFLSVSTTSPGIDRPDFCPNAFPTVITKLITNITALSNAMTDLLSRTLYGTSGYVLTTRRGKTVAVLAPVPEVKKWTVPSFYSAAYPTCVPAAIVTFVIAAQTILTSVAGDFARMVDGTLPPEVSFYDHPMAVTSGGATAQCSQVAFVAYSTYMLPVQRMLLTDVLYPDTSITAQRCANGVCAAATSVNTLGLTYNNPLQAQLPNDHMMVGSPFGDANGFLYDIEQRSISISPDPNARASTATYVLCPDDTLCPHSYWAEIAGGVPFDAFSATNSPSLYARYMDVDPITGAYRCNGTAPATAPTSTCDLREEFDFLPGSVDKQTLWLRPRLSGSYVLTFPVTMGSITQYIISACPTPSIVFANSNGVLLGLNNANAYDISISLSVVMFVTVQDGSCPPNIPDITVGAGGSAQVWIPACTQNPYAIMLLSAMDAFGNPCEGINEFNITIPPREFTVFTQGVPDRPYVHQTGLIVGDHVTAAMFESLSRLASAVDSLALEQLKTNRYVGVVDPTLENPADLTPFKNILEQTHATGRAIANSSARLAAVNFSKPNQILQDTAAHLAALDEQFAAARRQAQASMKTISELSALQNLTLQNIDSIRAAIAITSAAFNEALNMTLYLQRQLDSTIIKGLMELSGGDSDIDLGSALWSALKDVPGFVKKVGEEAYEAAKKAAEDLKPKWPDLGLGDIGQALLAVIVGICALVFFCVIGKVLWGMSNKNSGFVRVKGEEG